MATQSIGPVIKGIASQSGATSGKYAFNEIAQAIELADGRLDISIEVPTLIRGGATLTIVARIERLIKSLTDAGRHIHVRIVTQNIVPILDRIADQAKEICILRYGRIISDAHQAIFEEFVDDYEATGQIIESWKRNSESEYWNARIESRISTQVGAIDLIDIEIGNSIEPAIGIGIQCRSSIGIEPFGATARIVDARTRLAEEEGAGFEARWKIAEESRPIIAREGLADYAIRRYQDGIAIAKAYQESEIAGLKAQIQEIATIR